MTNKHVADIGTGWPKLPPLKAWEDTCTTVHMWTQIVGKVRLMLSPDINHSWGCTLYVSTRGLTTSPIPYRGLVFAIDFDFIDHMLHISTSEGTKRSFALRPMSVADFYHQMMRVLEELNIEISILTKPSEVDVAIPFEKDDQHASYDIESMTHFWRALVQADRVLKGFRARFVGKASPVHFFWGWFDLAATRFSGRTAPKHPGGVPNVAARITEEAYTQEVWGGGFWPGTGLGEAAFYAYAYPEPAGFDKYLIQPESAYFHDKLDKFVLPYETVRASADPDQMLLSFFQTTYEAVANLAHWDRDSLERKVIEA
ncbi:MAG: hypothetical protein ABS69_14495 [Nitrosomonadales bacterium SCN 54-20]|nr:MAG: hypothetical protein ABS69_14495 [Nitrosomonadales bacterium SCN 54-20]